MNFINRGADSMSNFERGLDVVSNNLANLQTAGYRAQRIVYQQTAGGNVTGSTSVVPSGGQLQATHVPTDLAVQGDGFFIVRGTDGPAYTRDGSFHMDPQGNLLFGDRNLAVLGHGPDDAGGPLSPIRIPVGQQIISHGSTIATASGNLDAGAAVYVPSPESGGIARSEMVLHDSLGIAHTVNVTLTKSAAGEWTWTAATTDASTLSQASGQIAFDGSGAPTTSNVSLTFTPGGGATADQPITLSFDELRQVAGASTATVQADAFQSGTLSSFSVGNDGTITGHYSTGTTATLGSIPLAHFSNPAGLHQIENNLLAATDSSGQAQIGAPGQGAFGTIAQGNLEGSNVDMTFEFSRMIMSQRAYQANSRLIRTGDEMWQDLLDLKR